MVIFHSYVVYQMVILGARVSPVIQETICGDVAAQGDDAVSVLQPCWQLGPDLTRNSPKLEASEVMGTNFEEDVPFKTDHFGGTPMLGNPHMNINGSFKRKNKPSNEMVDSLLGGLSLLMGLANNLWNLLDI